MNALPQKLVLKPHCELEDLDGSIMTIMFAASQTLREHGMVDQAREMKNRIIHCQNYHSALSIIRDYVIL